MTKYSENYIEQLEKKECNQRLQLIKYEVKISSLEAENRLQEATIKELEKLVSLLQSNVEDYKNQVKLFEALQSIKEVA